MSNNERSAPEQDTFCGFQAPDASIWNKWWDSIPADINRKLSLHDLRRLGRIAKDIFPAAALDAERERYDRHIETVQARLATANATIDSWAREAKRLKAERDTARADAERYKAALTQIAMFDDEGGNRRLARDGEYHGFDEPGSVQAARAALNPQPKEGAEG